MAVKDWRQWGQPLVADSGRVLASELSQAAWELGNNTEEDKVTALLGEKTRKFVHTEGGQGRPLSREGLLPVSSEGDYHAEGAVQDPEAGCPELCKNPETRGPEQQEQGARPGLQSKRRRASWQTA